ncbi:MAG: hypothetical protein ACREDN_08980, partial [Aestuariivirga sp.]
FAVGKCLTYWELVEEKFSLLFTLVAGTTDEWHYPPAQRAFGAIVSTTTRAEMIAQAAKAFFLHLSPVFHEELPLYHDLRGLLAAYLGWGQRRNDIAHGKAADTGSTYPDPAFLLIPGMFSTRKRPLEWYPVYEYSVDQLDYFCAEFVALEKRTEDFTARLDLWRAKPPPRPVE